MTETTITLPDFTEGTINLASPRLGTETVRASDDFFAAHSRMIQDSAPVFIDDKFDDNGKWMDGWESRRRRDGGHDWCLVRLGVAGHISGVDIDTSHFTGNFPPAASIEACLSGSEPGDDAVWTEIVPAETLGADAHHFVAVSQPGPWNWLRLNIFPDGGVARLRVYGNPHCDFSAVSNSDVIELSALKNGGRVVGYNNAHYGEVWALLSEGRGVNMGDGWETRRRREPGNDWLIVALGAPGTVENIEVDTCHFKGNFPDRCSIQAALVGHGTDQSIITQSMFWLDLMGEQKLSADHIHTFDTSQLQDLGPISHIRLNIHPDGGVSRLRINGKLAK